jgi:hypothetical protein
VSVFFCGSGSAFSGCRAFRSAVASLSEHAFSGVVLVVSFASALRAGTLPNIASGLRWSRSSCCEPLDATS